jgi:hypothetical protein
MPFVSRKEDNDEVQGVIPRATTKPAKPVKLTNRQLREKEYLSLLRKLKPLVAESIKTAANIMRDDKAAHQNQLKAAVLVLQHYKDMVAETYAVGYDEEAGEEIQQQNAPVFSLKMVNSD